MASVLPDEEEEVQEYYVHGMRHQKHVLRLLGEEGVAKVLKTEETPWTGVPELESKTLCFIHMAHGCACGARWRVLPRSYLNVLGGKVSMARLFRSYRLSRLCPTTYVNIEEYDRMKDEEEGGELVKWFIKISHGNSRKGMLCTTDPEAVHAHVATFPKRFRYVIQREVPNPLLKDGYKLLLRLWVLICVNRDGSVGLHFSKRLRVNRLQSKYDTTVSSSKGDLCHYPPNIFENSQTWEKYHVYWASCVATADLILRTMLQRWKESPAAHPALRMPRDGGVYNIFAMDYIPNTSGEAVLIEANVDPGFKNRCSETLLAAEDFVEFLFEPLVKRGKLDIPNRNFRSVHIEPEDALGSTGICSDDEEADSSVMGDDDDDDDDDDGDED